MNCKYPSSHSSIQLLGKGDCSVFCLDKPFFKSLIFHRQEACKEACVSLTMQVPHMLLSIMLSGSTSDRCGLVHSSCKKHFRRCLLLALAQYHKWFLGSGQGPVTP